MQIVNLKDKQILKAILSGNPTYENTKEVFLSYGDYINEIVPHDYSLLIDCTNMGIFVLDSVPILQNLFRLYMGTGFKRVIFIKSKSKVPNIQLSRVADMVDGFSGIFVDSTEQAMKICLE